MESINEQSQIKHLQSSQNTDYNPGAYKRRLLFDQSQQDSLNLKSLNVKLHEATSQEQFQELDQGIYPHSKQQVDTPISKDKSNKQNTQTQRGVLKKKPGQFNIMMQQYATPKSNYQNELSSPNNQKELLPQYKVDNSDKLSNDHQQQDKLYNQIKTIINVIGFVKYIKNLNNERNYFKLTANHFTLIGDIASNFIEGNYNIKPVNSLYMVINHILYYVKLLLQNSNVFSPDLYFILVWDFIMFLVILIVFIQIPISLAFTEAESPAILLILQFFLWIDMIINFNRGFYDQGQIQLDRRKIITNYFKKQFFIDLLSNIGFQSQGLTKLLFFVRAKQLNHILKDSDDNFQLRQRYLIVFELVKLLVLIFTLANFCGCGFNYIAKKEIAINGEQKTWLQVKELVAVPWTQQYVYSLYFAFITMVTVGYGDITPSTTLEVVYVIIMTLLSAAIFAYSVNTIGQIFYDSARKESSFRQTKYNLTSYLDKRNISKQLQIKLVKYLEYQYHQEGDRHELGQEIIKSMSKNLKQELYKEYFGKILKQSKIFYLNFSDNFIDQLCLEMKEITLAPGQTLINQYESVESLYFLIKGDLEISVKSNKSSIFVQNLQKGSILGYESFFGGIASEISAKSSSLCNIIFISKTDFLNIIKEYPLDYEKFCMMRDSLIFSNKKIDIKCTSCGEYSHGLKQCSLIHKTLNKYNIIAQYNMISQKERGQFRRKETKFKSLIVNGDVKKSLRHYRIKLINEVDPQILVDYDIDIQELLKEQNDTLFSLYSPYIDFLSQEYYKVNTNMCLTDSELKLEDYILTTMVVDNSALSPRQNSNPDLVDQPSSSDLSVQLQQIMTSKNPQNNSEELKQQGFSDIIIQEQSTDNNNPTTTQFLSTTMIQSDVANQISVNGKQLKLSNSQIQGADSQKKSTEKGEKPASSSGQRRISLTKNNFINQIKIVEDLNKQESIRSSTSYQSQENCEDRELYLHQQTYRNSRRLSQKRQTKRLELENQKLRHQSVIGGFGVVGDQEEGKQKKFFDYDFDHAKQFTNYFPLMNQQLVLKRLILRQYEFQNKSKNRTSGIFKGKVKNSNPKKLSREQQLIIQKLHQTQINVSNFEKVQ